MVFFINRLMRMSGTCIITMTHSSEGVKVGKMVVSHAHWFNIEKLAQSLVTHIVNVFQKIYS
jgi:hypothetical protein